MFTVNTNLLTTYASPPLVNYALVAYFICQDYYRYPNLLPCVLSLLLGGPRLTMLPQLLVMPQATLYGAPGLLSPKRESVNQARHESSFHCTG